MVGVIPFPRRKLLLKTRAYWIDKSFTYFLESFLLVMQQCRDKMASQKVL